MRSMLEALACEVVGKLALLKQNCGALDWAIMLEDGIPETMLVEKYCTAGQGIELRRLEVRLESDVYDTTQSSSVSNRCGDRAHDTHRYHTDL